MNKDNAVALKDRDMIADPLAAEIRKGAYQFIYQAVEAELLSLQT